MFEVLQSTNSFVSPEILDSVSRVVTELIQLAILTITAAIGYAVKLWINSLNSKWKQALATRLVSYAQQKIDLNDDKLNYVSTELRKFFPKMSEQEMNHFIEEAVLHLKVQLGKAKENPK